MFDSCANAAFTTSLKMKGVYIHLGACTMFQIFGINHFAGPPFFHFHPLGCLPSLRGRLPVEDTVLRFLFLTIQTSSIKKGITSPSCEVQECRLLREVTPFCSLPVQGLISFEIIFPFFPKFYGEPISEPR